MNKRDLMVALVMQISDIQSHCMSIHRKMLTMELKLANDANDSQFF